MDWNHKKKRAGIKAHRDKLPNSKVLLEAQQKLEQARMREASSYTILILKVSNIFLNRI